MCQPQSRGGKRCAAHTRPKFEAASFGTPAWDEAATEYARTKQGRERITAMALTAVAERDWDRAAASESALTRAARDNEVQAEWNRQRAESVRAVLLSYDATELRRASASSDPEIRAAAAGNSCTSEDVLLTLASDTSTEVRCAVACRPKAPDAVFERLLDDESPEVQRALKTFVDRPHSVLSRWSESNERSDRKAAAFGAGTQGYADILRRLADDPDWRVRDEVAGFLPRRWAGDLRRETPRN